MNVKLERNGNVDIMRSKEKKWKQEQTDSHSYKQPKMFPPISMCHESKASYETSECNEQTSSASSKSENNKSVQISRAQRRELHLLTREKTIATDYLRDEFHLRWLRKRMEEAIHKKRMWKTFLPALGSSHRKNSSKKKSIRMALQTDSNDNHLTSDEESDMDVIWNGSSTKHDDETIPREYTTVISQSDNKLSEFNQLIDNDVNNASHNQNSAAHELTSLSIFSMTHVSQQSDSTPFRKSTAQKQIVYWNDQITFDDKEKIDIVAQLPTQISSSDINLVTVNELSDEVIKTVLNGNLNIKYQQPLQVMRLYIHSAITDTEIERRYLIQKIYPYLKSYALQRNFELHITDLAYPPNQGLFDDHSQCSLPFQVLEDAMNYKDKFIFVTFLSHKYGQHTLCNTIGKTEFEAILKSISESEFSPSNSEKETSNLEQDLSNKQTNNKPENADYVGNLSKANLVRSFYSLDENLIPSAYRLKLISEIFPDSNSSEPGKKSDALKEWISTSARVQKLLQEHALKVFSDKRLLQKYCFSQPARELLKVNGLGHVVWVQRNFLDLNADPQRCSDFVDVISDGSATNHHSRKALDNLKQDSWLAAMPNTSILRYAVPWCDQGGVNPTTVRAHALYLEQLCTDVKEKMTELIDAIAKTSCLCDDYCNKVFNEVNRHIRECHKRVEHFFGRSELLQVIKQHVFGTSKYPFILYGKRGVGLTSLVAKLALDFYNSIPSYSISFIVRFVGLTSESQDINSLLSGICQQLHLKFYNSLAHNLADLPLSGLVNLLNDLLLQVNKDKPIFIIIDSPHLVSDTSGVQIHCEEWLPYVLPSNVRLILAVSNEESIRLQSVWKISAAGGGAQYFELPELQVKEYLPLMSHFLALKGRNVTNEQLSVLTDSLKACPLPLMLDIVTFESSSWWSDRAPSKLKLGYTMKSVLNIIVGRLERTYGDTLTKRLLGYITAMKWGVTYNELEDLLSLDEAALEEVNSQTKLTHVRRMPTVRVLRLINALGPLLVENNRDSYLLLKWSHQLYYDYAKERYLDSRDRAPSYHKIISEYFLDMWSSKVKPSPSNDAGLLRYVTSQPLFWEVLSYDQSEEMVRVFNIRRLTELPHHLFNSQQMDLLKSECLCNYEFILAKTCAGLLNELLADMNMVLSQEDIAVDNDIKLLHEALLLSAPALRKEPRQLGTQIIGRLQDYVINDIPIAPADPLRYPGLKQFVNQAEKGSVPALIPSVTCLTPPGGLKYDILAGHNAPIVALAITNDGRYAITASLDDTMKMWNIYSKRVLHTFRHAGSNVLQIRMADSDKKFITSEKTCIRIWGMQNYLCMATIDTFHDPASIVIAGEGKILVAFYQGNSQMCVWQLRENCMECALHIDIKDDADHCIHQDNSVLVAQHSLGTMVMYAFKSSNSAIVRSARDGSVCFTLKCGEATSIQAVAVTADYFACAVRVCYPKINDCYRLDLFDNKNGQYLRGMIGCTVDNISDLFVNKVGSHALALSPSDSLNMSSIAIWNIETEDHKHLAKHPKISTVGACVDLRACLTASNSENVVRIWNLSAVINQTLPKEKRQGIEDITTMVDNTRYVVTRSSPGGLMRVWNVSKGKPSKSIVRTEKGFGLQGHVILVRNAKVVILSDKNTALFSQKEYFFQTILFYDLKHKRFGKKLTGCLIIPCLQNEYIFLDDNHLLGLSDSRNHFVVWSLENGQLMKRIKPDISKVTIGGKPSDDHKIAEQRRKQKQMTAKMCAWDRRTETRSAREKRRYNELAIEKEILDSLRKEKENNIEQFIISRDGRIIVTSHFAHHAFVFDVPSGIHKHTLETPDSLFHLRVSALSSDGKYLIHTNYCDEIKRSFVTLWNLQSGVIKRRLRDETEVCAITINDTASVAVFLKDKCNIHVWKPRRPKSLIKIKGPSYLDFKVTSQIHIIDNGAKVVIFDGNVSVWDIEKGVLLALYMPDTNIQSFSVALGGRLIVLGMRNIPDLVIMKLMSKKLDALKFEGEDVFGEVSSSSSEDEGNEEESIANEEKN